jgi:hypothetical protein
VKGLRFGVALSQRDVGDGFRHGHGGEGKGRMELLEVTLTDLQRRNRAAFVSGREVPGGRVLGAGEKVVLRDDEGDYFAGTVIDWEQQGHDLRYLVHLGVRLPEMYAMLRLGRARPSSADDGDELAEIQSVLDMLGDVRDAVAGHPLPAQRPPR